MTKKDFKELALNNVYTSTGKRINAFFFGYKDHTWKFMAWCDTKDANKQELFDLMYKWCINEIELPWWVNYKIAETDEQRFKIPLSLR